MSCPSCGRPPGPPPERPLALIQLPCRCGAVAVSYDGQPWIWVARDELYAAVDPTRLIRATAERAVAGESGHLDPESGAKVLPRKRQGEALGYRAWRLEGHELASLNASRARWALGPNKADCRREEYAGPWHVPPHVAPHPDCACGLYAWHNPPSHWADGSDVVPAVVGAALLWGEAEVYDSGLRAEWAEPVVLSWLPDASEDHRKRVTTVAGEFGIEAVPFELLFDRAQEYGEPIRYEEMPPKWPPPDVQLGTHRFPADPSLPAGCGISAAHSLEPPRGRL
ncbi:MAG: hypothetical protein H0T96_06210 [Thermoleophilaceae bacterium]|jgi:hypothetical protein|nr:hypothetical protein [Thermoleophilaceae bacterium]MDQ3319243.1 hypothetical protein [Actinomycetota bacterium]MDQ3357048.1 hypothetical protein [Actinomycetota bacterium]